VEEHHGRIEVSSVEGKGSKFTVLLPFQMPAPEVAAP
jgi:signal transduction histidine kinase